jgi:hypothetical protein
MGTEAGIPLMYLLMYLLQEELPGLLQGKNHTTRRDNNIKLEYTIL